MKKNLLVTLADKNYIDQTKQFFSSVYFNAGWEGDYMLLAVEIPEKDLKWFRKKGILIKECKSFRNIIIGNYKIVMLDKLYLFTSYFKKWENIIYIDADTIVRGSLDELKKENGFMAVPDTNFLKKQFTDYSSLNNFKDKESFKELKSNYNLKKRAFSAGVMVFSTDIIEKNTFSNLINLLYKYNNLCVFGDQPILNLYFHKKWKELPIIYNFNPYYVIPRFLESNRVCRLKGIILHFSGDYKPWNCESCFYEEWKNNLKKAEFIDLKITRDGQKISKDEIQKYSKKIRILIIIYYPFKYLDKLLGKFGIFLKKYHSSLYYNLISLKNRLKKIN